MESPEQPRADDNAEARRAARRAEFQQREEAARQKRQQEAAYCAEFAKNHPELADLHAYNRETFAGAARRVVAFVVDCIVVVPTALLLGWMIGSFPPADSAAESVGLFGLSPRTARLVGSIVKLVLYDLYFSGLAAQLGRTWGQRFANIQLVLRDFVPPRERPLRKRYLLAGLSFLPAGIGLLSMFWNPHRRTWHDRATGTYMVRDDKIRPEMALHGQFEGERALKGGDAHDRRFGAMLLMLVVFAPGLLIYALLHKSTKWLPFRAKRA